MRSPFLSGECQAYLMKCQAVWFFIFIPRFQIKVIKCSAEGQWLWQLLDHLHGVCWENAIDPIDLSQVPVLIQLTVQYNDVTFVELQFSRVVSSIAIQSFSLGNLKVKDMRDVKFAQDHLIQYRTMCDLEPFMSFKITASNMEAETVSEVLKSL